MKANLFVAAEQDKQNKDPREGLASGSAFPASRVGRSHRRQIERVGPSDAECRPISFQHFVILCARSERLYGTFTKQLKHRRHQLIVLRVVAWVLWF